MSLPTHQREEIYYALIGPAAISALGASFVIVMYLTFSSLRSTSFKLVLFLSIFDLINAVSFLIPSIQTDNNSFPCQLQAVLLNFSSITSILWTTFIALFLLRTIKGSETFTEKTLWHVFSLNVFIGVVLTLIPFLAYEQNAYGKTRAWCWIRDEYFLLRDVLFIVPLFILIPINFIIYVRVAIGINRLLMNIENQSFKSKLKGKMLLYPFIIVVCYVPYTIKALLEGTGIYTDEFTFTLISGMLRCLHGFFNFCIYGFNPMVQKKLRDCFYNGNSSRNSSIISTPSLEN